MNFSLKPHPLVAHWVPGFATCLVFLSGYYGWNLDKLFSAPKSPGDSASVAAMAGLALVAAVVPFLVGEVLDSVRDVLENWFDLWSSKPVYWDFFFWCKREEGLENLEERYFTWYVLNVNLAVGVTVALLLWLLGATSGDISVDWARSRYIALALVSCVLVLAVDAMVLRRDVAKLTESWHQEERRYDPDPTDAPAPNRILRALKIISAAVALGIPVAILCYVNWHASHGSIGAGQ